MRPETPSRASDLRRIPIDRIKIDRLFVDGLGRSHDDTTLVEAIIRMAAGLRLDVVAEGAEIVEQARILESPKCPHGQGFLGYERCGRELSERLNPRARKAGAFVRAR
ncbi:MAG: EAL domain-containing protein [Solirubrobacterales bacterium]|nr:EAL domain-containing protein [Solirubrobacterales bacterium]